MIHRPEYDDWSLPKGKLDAEEDWEAAALREVEEETGMRCRLGRELPSAEYSDHRGRPKLVRYWVMEPVDGDFEPSDEVDQLRWLPREQALALLSYEHDRDLVRAATEGSGPGG